MNTAKEHYDQQLGAIYSWMVGNPEAALERNREFFRQIQLDTVPRGLAVDLGAGPGFQSIPLAELGFSVVAVDFCTGLLSELRSGAGSLPIRTAQDDILNFARYIDEQAQVVVCMGDTLTHLPSVSNVQTLLSELGHALAKDGVLVLTFRDYVSVELRGPQRFIPVQSDESRILSCFLEYEEEVVEVHDLLYQKEGAQWSLSVSSYPKLRLNKNWVSEQLEKAGLAVIRNELEGGMVNVVAKKNGSA